MGNYRGDITAGKVLTFKFNSANSSSVPTTLAGSPVLSVYKNGVTTESTAGVTLVVDHDGRTGVNHVAIDTSADGAFYAAGNDFHVEITTGTVGGTSVVGVVVAEFSIQHRTVDHVIHAGIAQAGDPSFITLAAGASGIDDYYKGHVVRIPRGTGAGQSAVCLFYNGINKQLNPDVDWIVTPDNTSEYEISDEIAPLRSAQTYGVKIDAIMTTGDTVANENSYNGSFTAIADQIDAGVPLATSQPNYAPAKAGDTMKVSVGTGAGQINLSGGKVPATLAAATDVSGAAPAGFFASAALPAAERSAIADALLDRADAVETGLTVRQHMRLAGAALLGISSNSGNTFKGAGVVNTRITATVDSSGNRTAITLDAT